MILTSNTIRGMKGEVLLYFHSKAFLPGTNIQGPLSGPVYVSRKYAKLCMDKGFNVEVVEPNRAKALIRNRHHQPKSNYNTEQGLDVFKD